MKTFRDVHGQLWHVPENADDVRRLQPRRRRPRNTPRPRARRNTHLEVDQVGGPIEDLNDWWRNIDTKPIEDIARKLADLVLAPIELVLDLLVKLRGLPRAIAVGIVLWQLTKRDPQGRI